MKIIPIVQIIISILLITSILLQQRGSGLGAVFGGSESIYRTKRGAERAVFIATIILALAFLGLALADVLLRKS